MAGENGASESSLTFEQGLRHFFREIEDTNPFLLLALAHAGGFAEQAPDWLRETAGGRLLSLGPHGERSVDELLTVWDRLRSASADEVFDTITSFLLDPSRSLYLVHALIKPLALVGRAGLVPPFVRRLLAAGQRDAFDVWTMVIKLGQAGAWDEVLEIFAAQHELAGHIEISTSYEAVLWKHVYHQRQTETVMPRLAALPFDPREAYSGVRKWQALAYRIRAGEKLHVAPIARDRQPYGYQAAAAMQIAALEHDAAMASYVNQLRGLLQDRNVTIHHANRGITMEATRERRDYLEQRIMIAARRKDYEKAAELARTPAQGFLVTPADLAVESFLEEGDWRGASRIAEEHDLRKRPVPRGFDDTRKREYLTLQLALATAAARAGDDEAAQRFLANYRDAVVSMPDPGGARARGRSKPVRPTSRNESISGPRRSLQELPKGGFHAMSSACS